MDPMHLISPCDGLLSVYDIDEDMVLPVKQSQYSLNDLFENEEVSAYFYGGTCLVFRLCVNHYHRYCYPLDGKKGENYFIPGVLHTVRPIALSKEPVFIRNCREYTIMENDIFGRAAQIEVGAMLVGKIHNNDGVADIRRGDEKGYFCYGGSTIILLLEPGAVRISEEVLDANRRGEEYPVKLGQSIGERV
jgi:phosphatidylserine decarboxylase